MTNLTAFRAPHESGFTDREGREVVVVHVALGLDDPECVELLLHPEHAESREVEHLGFATLEQAGAVSPRYDADLGAERTDVGGAAPVHPDAFVDDAGTHHLLHHARFWR